jgi:hypothetical protein
MTKPFGFLAGLIFTVFALAFANPMAAQQKSSDPKAPTVKEIQQNEKVRVSEATYQPGDVSPSTKRGGMRVIHALKGGTLERTYDDGKKETVQWKTGETRILSEEGPYAVKNVGKGVVRLFIVTLK